MAQLTQSIFRSFPTIVGHIRSTSTGQFRQAYQLRQASGFRAKELLAAPFTPLYENGEINFSLMDQCADFIVDTNYTGLFINGTLAEGVSMSKDERKLLAEGWLKASKGRLEVIAHVGANCIRESQELARHAEEIGLTAIAAMSPTYYKPESEEVLVEVMAQIAGAAPNTPFYYYEINFLTGLYINIGKFMEMAKKRIPTLRGLKNTSRSLPEAHNVSKLEDCQTLIGTDVQYLSCLALGMPGVICSSYQGNLFTDMRKAFEAGDIEKARECQATAQTIDNILAKYGGGINATKSAFKILTGMDAGPVRLPLREMTSSEFEAMKKDFIATGIDKIVLPRKK